MNREELKALAETVQKLTGPDYKIDGEIARSQGWKYRLREGPRTWGWCSPELPEHFNGSPPAYTADINAAMSLVPEGWTYVSLEVCAKGLPTQHCRVSVERLIGEDSDQRVHGYASTPALALTAAALLARAEQMGDQP